MLFYTTTTKIGLFLWEKETAKNGTLFVERREYFAKNLKAKLNSNI